MQRYLQKLVAFSTQMFTQNFDLGLKSVLTALEHDAHQRALKHSFWVRTEVMLKDVFGGPASCPGAGNISQ
jgi:hypothetical protein